MKCTWMLVHICPLSLPHPIQQVSSPWKTFIPKRILEMISHTNRHLWWGRGKVKLCPELIWAKLLFQQSNVVTPLILPLPAAPPATWVMAENGLKHGCLMLNPTGQLACYRPKRSRFHLELRSCRTCRWHPGTLAIQPVPAKIVYSTEDAAKTHLLGDQLGGHCESNKVTPHQALSSWGVLATASCTFNSTNPASAWT